MIPNSPRLARAPRVQVLFSGLNSWRARSEFSPLYGQRSCPHAQQKCGAVSENARFAFHAAIERTGHGIFVARSVAAGAHAQNPPSGGFSLTAPCGNAGCTRGGTPLSGETPVHRRLVELYSFPPCYTRRLAKAAQARSGGGAFDAAVRRLAEGVPRRNAAFGRDARKKQAAYKMAACQAVFLPTLLHP